MLRSPTVNGLKEAIAEKFELDYSKISKVSVDKFTENTNLICSDLQKTKTWDIS